jgi:hypothetical protein
MLNAISCALKIARVRHSFAFKRSLARYNGEAYSHMLIECPLH